MKKFIISFTGILIVFILSAQTKGKVKDIDGNEYQTVIIGKQEWMAENLKTTKLNDGKRITMVAGNVEWKSANSPAFSWYENDDGQNKNHYGALYNWFTVSTGKLCPTGWHVPSHAEWLELTNYLEGIIIPGTSILMEGELKSKSTAPDDHPGWDIPNEGATNSTGFSALPGGHRNILGPFNYMGKIGFWWTSTEASNFAYYRGMRYDNSDVFMTSGNKSNGFSVRCLRD